MYVCIKIIGKIRFYHFKCLRCYEKKTAQRKMLDVYPTLWDFVGKFHTERIPSAWILCVCVFSFQTKFMCTIEILRSWGRIEHGDSLSPCYPCCMCICVSKVTTCDSHNTGLRGDTRELFQVVGICIHTSVSSIDFNRLSNNFKWLHRYIDFGILEYLNEPFLHIRFSRLLL